MALFIACPSLGQEAPTAEPDVSAAESDTAYSAADIANRADEISKMLLDSQVSLETSAAETVDVPGLIDELGVDLNTLIGQLNPQHVESLGPSDAERYLQTFRRMSRELESWRVRLQSTADMLDGDYRALSVQRTFLESVTNEDDIGELPAAIVERVESTVADIDEVRAVIRDQLNGELEQLTRVSSFLLRINETIQIIEAGQRQIERDALSFDEPPIWKIEKQAWFAAENVQQTLRYRLQSSAEFFRANESAVIATLIALFIVSTVVVYGRHAIMRGPAEAGAEEYRRPLIERPISLAILLWTVISPPLFLPPMPLAIDTMQALIVIATLWRMLPIILPDARHGSVKGLLALVAVTSIVELIDPSDIGTRLILILSGAAGTWLFIGIRRDLSEPLARQQGLWWRVARATATVAPSILGIAVIGVLVGAVSFAEQTVAALLRLIIVVLAILVVENALNGMAYYFVNTWGKSLLASVRHYPEICARRLTEIIRLFTIVVFVLVLPSTSALFTVFYEWLTVALTADYSVGTLELSVMDILALIIGLVAAVLIARFIRFVLDEDVFPRLPVARGASAAASRLIYYALTTAGILMALAASGVELGKLTLVLSALGVGVGFGLQNVVNNFVSGIVLAFERPFQIGDLIAVGDVTARVRDIGLRASRVRTLDGAEVIVPNADLISGNVVNWTLSDRMRRIDISVGAAYGNDPGSVRRILLEVAEGSAAVAKYPKPVALFKGFGDSSLDFVLRVWTPEAGDWPQVTSDLNESINSALQDAGVEIPFPHRTLYIRSDDRAG